VKILVNPFPWFNRARLVVVVTVLFLLGSRSHGQAAVADRKDRTKTSEEVARPKSPTSELPDPLLQQARFLVDKGDFKQAEQTIRRYLDQHANSADGHYLLGFILFKQGKPQVSLSAYTQAAKFRDPSANDLQIVGLNYVLLEQYADADHWFTRSLELNPNNSQGWYYLGRTKYSENRFEEAISAFRECLNRDPKNVKAEDNLGLSYQALGRMKEALAAFREAIAWQAQMLEKYPGPFLDLGSLLLEQNQVQEAISYLRQAIEISPQESRAHEQLGKAYSRLNELEKAQEELERAVALGPESGPAHFMLGQVYRKRGLTEKAKIELQRGAALQESRQHAKPLLPRE
jgi:tetratricopeptide (TPR) repeat protein